MSSNRKRKTKFRQYVEDNDVSIEKLSNDTGIKEHTIYRIMQGYDEPSFKNVRKIVSALECTVEDLY